MLSAWYFPVRTGHQFNGQLDTLTKQKSHRGICGVDVAGLTGKLMIVHVGSKIFMMMLVDMDQGLPNADSIDLAFRNIKLVLQNPTQVYHEE